jgi:hypothetical protein
MMQPIILQFKRLENLTAEVNGRDIPLRLLVLEQTRTESSHMLVRSEVTLGLAVRAVNAESRVLSWFGLVDRFVAYTPEAPAAESPARLRYEKAWQQAGALREALAEQLRRKGFAIYADGLIEIGVANLLEGETSLINLARTRAKPEEEDAL